MTEQEAIQHVDYDNCDAALQGAMWVFRCGFMVHHKMFMVERTGQEEESLSLAHRRHHENSIGVRQG